MQILMIGGGETFPDGSGATARMRAYALGLRRIDVDVRVLLLVSRRPEAWPASDGAAAGEWHGVPFEYMSGLAHGQRGWMRRRLSEIRAIRRTAVEILRAGRRSGPTAVVLLGTSLRWILPVAAACRIASISLVHDRTEFPFVYDPKPGLLGRLWRDAYVATVFRLFDGVVVISTHLEEFIRARVRRGAWVLRIPILVEADAFACGKEAEPGLVGYAGSLVHPEELRQLIGAVSVVRREHPGTRLRIVGVNGAGESRFVEEQAARCGIEDAVETVGFATADRMPGLLCDCSALALPRSAGLFSSAGMPTKLGEYLSTGRPVVVTATGDIPKYLRDGIDAFMVEPGDTDAFASALGRALYEATSTEVGSAGRELARREFDPAFHMHRLLDAIHPYEGGRRT